MSSRAVVCMRVLLIKNLRRMITKLISRLA
jgi:hypothetical protein